jgi:hypothetical protein
MTVKEEVHKLIDDLPEETAIRIRDYIKVIQPDLSNINSPIQNGDEEASKERSARINALMGKYAGSLISSEEFARLKQEEIELEEAKIERAFRSCKP